ncbi:MAG TPA: hypothetical protein VIM44_03970 [Rariglobus sp.]
MNCPNAFMFLTVGLAMLVLRAVLVSAESISDGRAAWLLVMGVVFGLIAGSFFLRRGARRARLWIEPRVSAWIALTRAQAEPDRGRLPAANGVRVSV